MKPPHFGDLYTLFQNGHHFIILLFTCKLAIVGLFLNSKFKGIFSLNEATRANFQVNKRILKWRPFFNKVYKATKGAKSYLDLYMAMNE